jgi:hypothetical protein
VEGGGGGLTVSGVSRNHGSFVKCVAIQKRLGIPGLLGSGILPLCVSFDVLPVLCPEPYAVGTRNCFVTSD